MHCSKTLTLALAIFTLYGCATRAPDSADREIVDAEARLDIRERDAAMRTRTVTALEGMEESVRMLAELRNAEQQLEMSTDEIRQVEYNSTRVPPRMSASATMDGPYNPLEALRFLAQQSMYRVVELGVPPANMPLIDLSGTASIHEHTRNVGAQLGETGLVRVVVASSTIELDWTYGRQQQSRRDSE